MKSIMHSLLVCSLLLAFINCGGNNTPQQPPPPPPPPAVTIAISANTATVHTTGYNDVNANTFQFTATVQNATDKSVTWDLNGGPAGTGDIGFGTISTSGLYTAPMTIPTVPIQVRATANADTTKTASATITLVWSAQLYNLQVASSVETSSSTPVQLFFDTYGPRDLTWSVNGMEMGTATGGAISLDYTRLSGNYIAPATVPAGPVHITATLKSNGQSLSKDVTITANSNPNDPIVTVTPAEVTLEPGALQSFAAAVTNNGNPVAGGITWEAGTWGGGSYSHVLTDGVMNADGSYTAPYDPPDSRVVVVNAYYGSASVPKNGYAIVTLADPAVDPNQRLNGQYAFSFHDPQYFSSAFGTFVADGHGTLTGTMDLVSSLGTLTAQPFTGTYTAHPDGRVQAVINYTPAGSQTFTQPISLMLVSDTRAYASTSGPMGTLTGTVEKQDTTAFDSASLLGDYGFLLNGTVFSIVNQSQIMNATADGGIMTLNPDGSVSGAITWDDSSARNGDLTGNYTFDTTTGRGALTLSTTGTDIHLNFAVISPNKLLISSTDQLPTTTTAMVLQGWAERRTLAPPLSAANLNGPFAFYLAGPQWLEVGRFMADGAGTISHGLLDMRDTSYNAPIPKITWSLFDGTYSVTSEDAPFNRGRLYFSSPGTSTNPASRQYATFYMIAPDRLIILMDSMTTAITGEAFQQSPSTGAPDDNRYAVHFTGPDMGNYSTGWIMPLQLSAGTPWVGWRDTNGGTKSEWELYASGAQLDDVYTFNVLIGNGTAFPNVRAYAISPSKLMLIGLDMGYSSPNEFIWMEELQNSPPAEASRR